MDAASHRPERGCGRAVRLSALQNGHQPGARHQGPVPALRHGLRQRQPPGDADARGLHLHDSGLRRRQPHQEQQGRPELGRHGQRRHQSLLHARGLVGSPHAPLVRRRGGGVRGPERHHHGLRPEQGRRWRLRLPAHLARAVARGLWRRHGLGRRSVHHPQHGRLEGAGRQGGPGRDLRGTLLLYDGPRRCRRHAGGRQLQGYVRRRWPHADLQRGQRGQPDEPGVRGTLLQPARRYHQEPARGGRHLHQPPVCCGRGGASLRQ